MEVTRQLRLNQPGKNGLVQIQMTCHWQGGRLRLSTGLTSAAHAERCQWTRDLFLLCTCTSLRHGDAAELGWQHIYPEQRLIRKLLSKTDVVGLIPYLDDVF